MTRRARKLPQAKRNGFNRRSPKSFGSAEVTSIERSGWRKWDWIGLEFTQATGDMVRCKHESAETLAYRESVGLTARFAFDRVNHRIEVGRLTEGFYDTALNEANDV